MKSIAPRSNLKNRYPREHFNSAKKTKKTFETEYDAEVYLDKHNLAGYTVYKCKVCNKFHVSHKNKEIKRNEQHAENQET